MSKYYYLLISTILVVGTSLHAYAGEPVEADCVSPSKSTSLNGKNKWHLHDHCYTDKDTHAEDRKNPVGVGVDIKLYEDEKVVIENQNKFDFRNDEYSNFTVVEPKLEEGILQTAFGFIKGLFNRE
jgi:hypothetical protein